MITPEEIVTEDTVASMLQAQVRANFGFRQLFRRHDGSGAGPKMSFPVTKEDFDGALEEVEPGTEYEKFEKEYGEAEAVYAKYGFETDLTDEALADGVLDLRLDSMRSMMDENARGLNELAANIVKSNYGDTFGDNNGDMTFDEVVDARAKMVKFDPAGDKEGYVPDMLLVDPLAAADILKSKAFKLRDTPVGDRAVLEGFVGSVAGMDIFEDTSGVLGDNNAFMADTTRYGYESAKYREKVSTRRDDSQDKTTYKIKDRLDWVSTNQNAVAKIEG